MPTPTSATRTGNLVPGRDEIDLALWLVGSKGGGDLFEFP